MPATILTAFKNALATSVRPGLAVRISLQDGRIFAFNNLAWDRNLPELVVGDITIPPTLYRANHAYFPANLKKSVNIRSADYWLLEVLFGTYVVEAEVSRGDFEGGEYMLILFNRDNTSHQMILASGTVGEAITVGKKATLRMRGLVQPLQQNVLESMSPLSKAEWGDPELDDFDLDGDTADGYAARVTGSIDSVDADWPRRKFVFSATEDFPSERFVGGQVLFQSGDNNGFTAGVQSWDEGTGTFILDRETPADIVAGVSIRAQIGPPRTLPQWRAYTGSGFGFPAFPGIPTVDMTTQITQE